MIASTLNPADTPRPRSRALVSTVVAIVFSIVAWQLASTPSDTQVITAGVSSGNLVMVTGDGAFSDTDDAAKKALFEGFGWTVTAIDDGSSAGQFATSAAANDVLYFSDSSSTGSLLVRDLDIGVVAEIYGGWSNMLYAPSSGVGYSSQTQLDIVDTSHYITSGFSSGTLAVYTASSDLNYWQSGAQALPAGVTSLAESPTGASDKALMVAETGATLYSSNTAVNRRVWFPTDFAPVANYTSDLEDLLERSLEWASGMDLSATVTVNSTGDAVDNNIGDSRCDTGATNSDGADECTLRAAIAEANASALVDTIEFAIPTGESGYTGSWWTITVGTTELPRITTDMTVDGSTQTGYSSAPLVVVDGSAITSPSNGDSLGVDSGTVTVRALSLVNSPDDGLQHLGSGSVEDNYAGLLPDGTAAGNGANGLNLVGTNLTVDGNVASANPIGVRFDGSGTTFINNRVGTDPTGLLSRGNSNVGGIVIGATNLTIGGVGAGSVFAGNGADGLWVTGGSGLVIEGSFFGVGPDGTTAVPNGTATIYEAIDLQTSTGSVRVGGTAAGAGNVVYGGGDGIRVGTAVEATILGNSIYGSTGLGIDLNDDGVTANDAGDGDSGPNDYLNFPVITAATESIGTVSVDYELDVPAGDYRIEFFENPSGANATGYGEGEDFVHGVTVTHAGAGTQSFSTSFSGNGGVPLTTTSTEDLGGGSFGPTSEFSLAVTTCVDDDGDGLCTHHEALFGDTDGDSLANSADADDDGDNIATIAESADPNDDGDPRDAVDSDRDGQPDYLDEPLASTTGLVVAEQKISDIAGNGPDVAAGDGFGRGVASIGDLDGDGIVDALVGAQGGDDGGADRGEAHVLFLNSDGSVRASQKISSTTGGLNASSLDDGDRFGQSVAGLGDIDGDAVPDIAVGARQDDDGGTDRGAVYVLFLNTNGTVKEQQKISQSAGGGPGLDNNDEFGQAVAGIGDLDGDGTNDLAIGTWFDDDGGAGRGAAYVAFLNPDGSARATQKISSTTGGLTGPLNDNGLFGVAVSGPGDIDGDGIEDLVVGVSQDSDGGSNRGAVYVLFLNTDGTVRAEQKISSSAGGLTGPLGNNDKFGVGVSGVGDLNRDGVPDIAVGAELDDDGGSDRGGLYLLFLNADGTVQAEQKISDTEGGFATALDNSDQFGNVVASLGDLDGDGSTSLLVGANADDDGGSGAGAAYVLELNGGCGLGAGYGSSCPFSSLGEVPLTADGRFWFDFGNGPFEASVTNDEGGRWVMVLQYHHRGGTDPALDVRSTTDDWPSYAPAVQNVDRSGTAAWGHIGQAAAAAIPDTSGELELRWAAETSNHGRVTHFRSPVLGEFQGDGADNFFIGGINSDFTALSGHTSNLPGAVTAAYSDQGDLALTNFPYFRSGAYHWGIDGLGYRWEIDDYNNGSSVDTVHQVWVRNGRIPAVVNSSGDSADQTPGDAICNTGGTNSEGDVECTLRAAIEEANASSLVDTVEFNLPTSDTGHSAGVWTIRPTAALPTVSTAMKIDGSTQTGFSTDPIVAIQADLAGSTALSVTGADSEIRSLIVFDQSALGLALTSADRTVVAGNWIGLDTGGTSAGGTVGLVVSGGADVVIGGTTAEDRNVISGNGSDGIQVSGSPSGLAIVGNSVGVGTDGSADRGNGGDGIQIVGGTGTRVGGVGAGEGNTIAYNGTAGISLTSSDDNPFLANNIYSNGTDGLDLGTANNNLTVPSPVSATVSGGTTAAVVDLNLPAGDYRLEFFANPGGVDPSGGEGQIYRGATSVTHTGSGVEQFSTAVTGISIDDVLTITATEDLGGGTYGSTSEFSTSITAVAIVPPVLKAIQSGTVTLTDGTSTVSVPITAVDDTKTFTTFTYRGDHSDPSDLSVSGGLSNPTTLDFQRVGTNGDIVIEWSVVEFTSGVSVQRGSVLPASTTEDVTITAVDQSTSFVLVNHQNNGTAFGADDFVSGQLTSGTNLRLSSVNVTNQIDWQVVSYDGALVTRGTTNFGTGDLTLSETVPAVDLSRSWLVYSMTTDAGTTNDIGQKLIRGLISDATTLTFDRHNSGQAATVAWELVQFPDGIDVQHGSAAFAAAATTSDVTITEVMPGRSLAVGGRNLIGGRTPYNTIDNIGVASFTTDLTSGTNLRVQRSADDDEADLGWFVIHWPCTDTDGDGLCDDAEDANTDTDDDPSTSPGPDSDGDGTANYLDSDDDGDGTPTSAEQPDPNGDGTPSDAKDTDRDGEPDYLDVEAGASVGWVITEHKISDTAGGFGGLLEDNDQLGFGTAPLGDLDGDGVADLAVTAHGDDDGGTGRGAIYVLFLNADGTVKAEQKISDTAGGLNATLDNGDVFGFSMVSLGDLDGDGLADLAVGANADDDGGSSRGAVYVLFLNADGTVKAEQKISDTAGGLSAALDDSDRFGTDLGNLGDLDGDGVVDLAVGATGDDDGGSGRGAVYVLFLNADGTVKAEQKISDTSGGLNATLDDNDWFGTGIAGPGDIDGDGVNDLAVGAMLDGDGGSGRGAIYVVFLNPDGTVKGEQKISATAGGGSALGLADDDWFAERVTGVGDFNGDGVPDLMATAGGDDTGGTNTGVLHIISLDAAGNLIDNTTLSAAEGNVAGPIDAGDFFGYGLAGLGDRDGDGGLDIAVGANWDDDGGTNRGAIYLFDLAVGCGSTTDTDADGLYDCWEDADTDADGDPATNPGPDTDADTTPNYLDADDDGDGTNTGVENADPNGDGNPRDAKDTDRDGQPDYLDAPSTPSAAPISAEQKISETTGDLTTTLTNGDRFGYAAASLGDVDGDGIVDAAVGAPFDDDGGTDRGAVYVLFLDADSTVKAEQKISQTTGGLSTALADSDQFGMALAQVGDLDGDGISELAVGAALDDDGGGSRGAVHVLFLNTDGTVRAEQKISDTSGGLAAILDDSDMFGTAVSGIGDVDGDGISDLAVSAPGDDDGGTGRGAAYVLFLNADGTVKAEQKISDTAGDLTAVLDNNDQFGASVAGLGDLDDDGILDIAVGASRDADGGTQKGAVYILFLDADGTVKAEQKISDTEGGLPAVLSSMDQFGTSATGVGDLDGDGNVDLAVGAPLTDDGATDHGRLYLLFLNANGTVKASDIISDTEGGFGGALNVGDRLGFTIASLGDLDGDGLAGLLVGAERDDDGGNNRGAVYVLELSAVTTATVNSTGDAGDTAPGDGVCATGATNAAGAVECTLRAAIEEANAATQIDTINFNIPTSDSNHTAGVWTIAPGSAFASISSPVTIDAFSQPGASANTVAAGSDAVMAINLDGTTSVSRGFRLVVGSEGSTIKGFVINRFTAEQIRVDSDSNTLVGNWFGVEADGATPAVAYRPIFVYGDNTTIGGTDPADRNVISGSIDMAVYLGGNTDNTVLGNYVGTDPSGSFAIPNNEGVRLHAGVSNNTVGGTATGAGNLISGNTLAGIRIRANATNNTVVGNTIGLNASGASAVPNGIGVWLDLGAEDNTIGGTAAGAGNVISGNTTEGVAIYGTAATDPVRNAVLGNSIYSNGALGIDLSASTSAGDGVTANDAGDGDSGANDLLNHPIITGVTTSAPGATVDITVDVPAGTYRVEFFANPVGADPNGYGEGGTFIHAESISHTGSGEESFAAAVATFSANWVSATVTEDLGAGDFGSTSEFGPTYCVGDSDGDGLCDGWEAQLGDTDGDTLLNELDADDDGDGAATAWENADPNGDRDPRDALDTDTDGQPDYLDVEAGASALPIADEQKISDSAGNLTGSLVDSGGFGFSVTPAGDVDNDGVNDAVVGVPFDDDGGTDRGAVYVLFLDSDGTVKAEQKISSTVGGKATLTDSDQFGRDVASLGDVDGDGVPDVAVGSIGDDDGGLSRGAVYVLFLNADGTVKAEQKISSDAGGLVGPLDDGDLFGHGVGGIGDLDGDGIPDLAVSARQDDDGGTDRGAFYVLFLNRDGTVRAEQKISDTSGDLTETLEDGDIFGANVSAIGDLDGDGVTDIVAAAPRDDDGGTWRGALYVLFMNTDGTVKGEQKISSLSGGFTGTLADSTEWGYGLDGPGDVDGDGILDLVAGSWNDSSAGTTEGDFFVLLMNTDGTVRETELVNSSTGGLTGPLDSGDRFGVDLAGIGDLDGDGTLNLIVGSPYDDDGGSNRGAVYILDLSLPPDTDGDGLWDHQEDDNTDADNDPATNPGPDTDGDTIPNYLDDDDDGDGTATASENPDPNGDGDPRDAIDSDRDGQPDWLDRGTGDGTTPIAGEQKISDLLGNFVATLDDNDTFGVDVDGIGDLDGDGINDMIVGALGDDDGGADRGAVHILFMNTDGTVRAEQKISSTVGGLVGPLDNSDQFGTAVDGIGDLDGDGVPDVAVGVWTDDDGGTDRGAVYILFLNADGTVKAEQKISGTSGGLTQSLDNSDQFGATVEGIGDLDGDGVNDLAVGAFRDDDGGSDRGAVHVLFLHTDGTVRAEQKISSTAGGLTGPLDDNDQFGRRIAATGDIDGDGTTDLAVGAYPDDDGGADRGAVYILFMNTDGTVRAEQKISSTAGGFTGPLDDNDQFGMGLAGIGDLDKNGVPDLAASAFRDDDGGIDRGAAYILFLNANGTVKTEQKISSTAGGLTGPLDDSDWFGSQIASLGDLDRNGAINLAVGARQDDDGGTNRGAVYVLDLQRTPCGTTDADSDGLLDCEEDQNADADNDPATNPGPDTDGDGVANYLDADDDGDGAATATENADPNGDGAPWDALDTDRDGEPDYLDRPTSASDGTVRIQQEIGESIGGFTTDLANGDRFGRSVASIGDLNGDGVADLVVGARYDDDGGSNRGAVYVLFLNADGTVKAEQKISDTAGGLATELSNGDNFGLAVAGLGDVDGDGLHDLAVGAYADDDGGNGRGAVYVLFLNADGTVKGEQKISDTQGGLATELSNDDNFGFALGSLGDLDGDGVYDLAVGAYADDDGGNGRGAVYVLFLNPDGTVKREQKISDTTGGLTVALDDSDSFGFAVAGVGDLDGDNLPDLVVGARNDNDGGTGRGAVYVLLLNADGTVKAEQKISDTTGGLAATLDNNDEFGVALAGVGDVDADGTVDLVVGARDDDDGGTNRGAVYLLFLNTDGTVKAEQKISSTAGDMPPVLEDGVDFGLAIAGVGDLDGDGTIGLAVGAQLSGSGQVHILNLAPTPVAVAEDASVRRNDLTGAGGLDPAATTAGIAGDALSYDGADDRLVASATDVTSGALTLSGWINSTSFGTDPRIAAKASADGAAIYELLVDDSSSTAGVGAARIKLGGTTYLVSGGAITAGAWHHLVSVWDGSTLSLFVDGVLVDSTAAAGTLDTDLTVPLTVGNLAAANRGFSGVIDEVRLSHDAPTAAEVSFEYNNVANPSSVVSIGGAQTGTADPWTISSTQTRSGTNAARAPEITTAGRDAWLRATTIDEPGLEFTSWWWLSASTGVDVAAGTRAGAAATNQYETAVTSSSGWDLATEISGARTQQVPPAGTPPLGSWVEVTMRTDEAGNSTVIVDGTEIIAETAQGTALLTGSAALRAGLLPIGEFWYVDDARVRKLIGVEPTATLGPLERN